ncbi:MAG: hypothetical protein WCO13_14655 [Bacteroidota bacterium]
MKALKYCISLLLFTFLVQGNQNKEILKDSFKSNNDSSSTNAKEKKILENVAKLLIELNKEFIAEVSIYKKEKDRMCKRPLFMYIIEAEKYKNFRCFTIYFSDKGMSDTYLPSYLIKKNNLYIAMYFDKQTHLSKNSIPDILFKECDGEFKNEDSWSVLICIESFKFIVVNTGLLPKSVVKQFQEFSCDKKDKKTTQINVEEPIVIKKMIETIGDSIRTQ